MNYINSHYNEPFSGEELLWSTACNNLVVLVWHGSSHVCVLFIAANNHATGASFNTTAEGPNHRTPRVVNVLYLCFASWSWFKWGIIHTEAEQGDICTLKHITTKCNLLQERLPWMVRSFWSSQVIHATKYATVVMTPLSKQYHMTIEGSVYGSRLPQKPYTHRKVRVTMINR